MNSIHTWNPAGWPLFVEAQPLKTRQKLPIKNSRVMARFRTCRSHRRPAKRRRRTWKWRAKGSPYKSTKNWKRKFIIWTKPPPPWLFLVKIHVDFAKMSPKPPPKYQTRGPAPDSKLLVGRHRADCRQHWLKPGPTTQFHPLLLCFWASQSVQRMRKNKVFAVNSIRRNPMENTMLDITQ